MKTLTCIFTLIAVVTALEISAVAQNQLFVVDREQVEILPKHTTPTDSIYLVFSYVSSDGCPDYLLVVDSIVGKKWYVNLQSITRKPEICITVITPFTIRLNLGVMENGSEIYFRNQWIKTIQHTCTWQKMGVVVKGRGGCNDLLLIHEMTIPATAIPVFYKVDTTENAHTLLQPGDVVRFDAQPINVPLSGTCNIVGIVTCYEVIQHKNTFSLSGKALAGNNAIHAGKALLLSQNPRETRSVSAITNGKFLFSRVPEGTYTVFVVPDPTIYKQVVPTFYRNKLRLKNADFFSLNQSIDDLTVLLQPTFARWGSGSIHGNISFETESMRDTLLSDHYVHSLNRNAASFIPVTLFDSENKPVAWTLTDGEGNYQFNDLAFDRYRIVPESLNSDVEKQVTLHLNAEKVTADVWLQPTNAPTATITLQEGMKRVFPNPFTHSVTVSVETSGWVRVYNTVGQLIHQQALSKGANTLNVCTLPLGVLVFQTHEGTFRVLKQM